RLPAVEEGEQRGQLRGVLLQLRKQRLHPPDEDAAVPQVGPAGEVLTRRVAVRLLDEVGDVERLRLARDPLTDVDVTESGFRPRRADADREQTAQLCRQPGGSGDQLPELLRWPDD